MVWNHTSSSKMDTSLPSSFSLWAAVIPSPCFSSPFPHYPDGLMGHVSPSQALFLSLSLFYIYETHLYICETHLRSEMSLLIYFSACWHCARLCLCIWDQTRKGRKHTKFAFPFISASSVVERRPPLYWSLPLFDSFVMPLMLHILVIRDPLLPQPIPRSP